MLLPKPTSTRPRSSTARPPGDLIGAVTTRGLARLRGSTISRPSPPWVEVK
jgi:hypothetical protein